MVAEEEQEQCDKHLTLSLFSHRQNRRIFCLQTNFHAAIDQEYTFEIHKKDQ